MIGNGSLRPGDKKEAEGAGGLVSGFWSVVKKICRFFWNLWTGFWSDSLIRGWEHTREYFFCVLVPLRISSRSCKMWYFRMLALLALEKCFVFSMYLQDLIMIN